MTNRIYLNHSLSPKREILVGNSILFVGVIAIAISFLWIQDLFRQANIFESDIHHIQTPSLTKISNLSNQQAGEKQQEMKAVENVMSELSLPWQRLFVSLEQLNSEQVKLVSLEPNPIQHKLRVTGQASSEKDMLDYVQRMNGQEIFKDALLVSYERTEGAPMTVSFIAEGVWQ